MSLLRTVAHHRLVRSTFLPRIHLNLQPGLSASVTTYTYHPDGSVEHKDGGPGKKMSSPPDSASVSSDESYRTAGGVEAYLARKVASAPDWGGDRALAKAQKRANEAGMPRIAVSPLFGQFLALLVKSSKAEKVLEIGTLAGYSTTFLARALPAHGQIDTLEYSPKHAKVAQQNFLDADLFPFPKVHVGRALDVLRDPKGAFAQPPGAAEGLPEEERGYDLVFIDANKEDYFDYFVESLRLLKKGGTIVFDNAIRSGRIAVPDNVEPDFDVTGLRAVYDWIEKDAGKTVLASALQTVGDKSWDGFIIMYKL